MQTTSRSKCKINQIGIQKSSCPASSLSGELVVTREREREHSVGGDGRKVVSNEILFRGKCDGRGVCTAQLHLLLPHSVLRSYRPPLGRAFGEAAPPASVRLASFCHSRVGEVGWSWHYPPALWLQWGLPCASHSPGLRFSLFQPNALLAPSPLST